MMADDGRVADRCDAALAQFGSPGVCHVPRLAFVASCQQAIREFRVRLVERKHTPALGAAENRDGFL